MASSLVTNGSPNAVSTAVGAMTAQPGNTAEAATLARLIPVIQTEITNMSAANGVAVSIVITHTEKTCSVDFQIDKATPVLTSQLIQLSNQSPAN